jgi:hypothetical protein
LIQSIDIKLKKVGYTCPLHSKINLQLFDYLFIDENIELFDSWWNKIDYSYSLSVCMYVEWGVFFLDKRK